MSDDPEIIKRAEDLYVQRAAALDAGPAVPGSLTFADLLSFLLDAGSVLLPVQQRQLFADPRLRADYARLKRDVLTRRGAFELPRLVAAGDRDLDERRFPGGVARLAPSATDAAQIYLVIELDDRSSAPRTLILEADIGTIAKLALPAPDDGIIQLLLDERSAPDAQALALLRDPNATGALI